MFRQENRKTRQMLASGHIAYEDDPYPTTLNFYKVPPELNITIVEFEQFALDRMQGTSFFNAGSYCVSSLVFCVFSNSRLIAP